MEQMGLTSGVRPLSLSRFRFARQYDSRVILVSAVMASAVCLLPIGNVIGTAVNGFGIFPVFSPAARLQSGHPPAKAKRPFYFSGGGV
jgi:hypothetical protein